MYNPASDRKQQPLGRSGLTYIAAQNVSPPSLLLAMSEFPRAFAEFGLMTLATPFLLQAPRGDGHPVLLLPGFMATEASLLPMQNFLGWLGYDAYHWELGRNLGPRAIGPGGIRLIERLEQIYKECGEKVSLVGWSLGGTLARQLSRGRPDMVRQVISLGSPIVGSPKSTSVWRAYEWLSLQRLEDPEVQKQVVESQFVPPVPSTAIWSRQDGVVPWENSREPQALHTDNIEVNGSHCGLGHNPAVLWAVADRLAQADGAWQPFHRNGIRQFAYPSAGH